MVQPLSLKFWSFEQIILFWCYTRWFFIARSRILKLIRFLPFLRNKQDRYEVAAAAMASRILVMSVMDSLVLTVTNVFWRFRWTFVPTSYNENHKNKNESKNKNNNNNNNNNNISFRRVSKFGRGDWFTVCNQQFDWCPGYDIWFSQQNWGHTRNVYWECFLI